MQPTASQAALTNISISTAVLLVVLQGCNALCPALGMGRKRRQDKSKHIPLLNAEIIFWYGLLKRPLQMFDLAERGFSRHFSCNSKVIKFSSPFYKKQGTEPISTPQNGIIPAKKMQITYWQERLGVFFYVPVFLKFI